MLRLDPGEGRAHTARQFTAWEGGGEYNVARGLRRCFGLKTGVVTAFADNPVGRLVEDFIMLTTEAQEKADEHDSSDDEQDDSESDPEI